MGNPGAGIAYAGQDLTQAIRQMMIDRMTQAQTSQNMDLAQRRQTLDESEAAQRAKIGDAQLASITDERAAAAERNRQTSVNNELNPLSPGAVVSPSVVDDANAAHMSDRLIHQTPTLPSTADTTPVTLPGNGQGAQIVGTPRMVSNPGNPDQYVNRGTDAQQTEDAQKKAQAAYIADPNAPEEGKNFLRLRGMVTKGESVPPQAFGPPKTAPTGDANYMLNGKPIVALKQNGRLTYQGQDVTDRVSPYTPPQQPIVIQGAVGPELLNRGAGTSTPIHEAGSGEVVTRTNPQIARQQKMAELASGDVSDALDQVDSAEKAGLLGPGSGRLYGQFLAGIVGSTGDAQVDQKLGALKTAISNLNQSYPPALTGSTRGAGSAERLKNTLDSDKFSADLLRGSLHEMGGALARRVPTSGDKPKLSADELLKKYGG